MERVEINKDLTRSEPIREVRQTKDTRTGEATKKQFVAELEQKLARKKKKKRENKKDEIILHNQEEKKKNKRTIEEKEKNNERKINGQSVPSPDGSKGNEVDYIA